MRAPLVLSSYALFISVVVACGASDDASSSQPSPDTDPDGSSVSGTLDGGGALDGATDASQSTGACPALPAFPDTMCTGWQHTGVALVAYAGPDDITVDGTTIDSADIASCLTIHAKNVTIRRSRLRCKGGSESTTSYGIYVDKAATGLVVEDTEVSSTDVPTDCEKGDPPLLTRPMYLNESEGARLTRVYFHNVRTGIGVGNGTTVEDSVLLTDCNPDPHNGSGTDWQHSTSINSGGGAKDAIIRHNVLDNGAENASSSMSFYPDNRFGGPNDNFKIEGNLINARAYYCAYFGYTPSSGESPNTRFSITNNVWGTKYNADCGESSAVTYSNFDLNKFNQPFPGGWGGIWTGNTWRNGQSFALSDL